MLNATDSNIETLLGGISPKQFLAEYWHKKPLLIRQAFPNYQSPISADELAGLAMEEAVESRIIQEQGKSGPWEPKSGPFTEEAFAKLPKTHWTLLIQQLDAWVPEINELKQFFNFIPNWRFDDIMASYAPDGGSVGPHYDQYDVFLLQAEGKRHWRTGQVCDEHSARLDNTPLRILKDFKEDNNWILEPGDMLYLPPNIAHYGIALGECMTFSIGYRAPTHSQILSHFTDYLLEQVNPTSIYEDSDLTLQHSGEISDLAFRKLQKILNQYTQNPSHLKRWFGKFSTETKNEHFLEDNQLELSNSDFQDLIDQDIDLIANEGSRFAFTQDNDTLLLFVDGKEFELQADNLKFVQTLCEMQATSITQLLDHPNCSQIRQITLDLLQLGSLYFED